LIKNAAVPQGTAAFLLFLFLLIFLYDATGFGTSTFP
jgi:hypothetical protein